MKNVFVIVALLALTACGRGPQGVQGERGEPGAPAPVILPPVPEDPVQDEINALVNEENEYRLGLGQTMLSPGLSCTLYTITGGDRIQSSIAGHNTLTGVSQVATFLHKDVFNQENSSINDGMSVLPTFLRNIYKNMYLLRCQGQIVVLETGYYQFDLTSDDASLLYLNGSKLIDNDNNHGSTTVSGSKYLRRGVHTFRIDYAQAGGGSQSLILKANGELIEGRFYMH